MYGFHAFVLSESKALSSVRFVFTSGGLGTPSLCQCCFADMFSNIFTSSGNELFSSCISSQHLNCMVAAVLSLLIYFNSILCKLFFFFKAVPLFSIFLSPSLSDSAFFLFVGEIWEMDQWLAIYELQHLCLYHWFFFFVVFEEKILRFLKECSWF